MLLPHFERLADERIKKAQEEGQFDNLEGAGKPLVLEDDSMIPEDLRMAYKVLKNSGFLPPEVNAAKDIKNALDLLDSMTDEAERYRQMQKLNYMIAKAQQASGRNLLLEESDEYFRKIVERISLHSSKNK